MCNLPHAFDIYLVSVLNMKIFSESPNFHIAAWDKKKTFAWAELQKIGPSFNL